MRDMKAEREEELTVLSAAFDAETAAWHAAVEENDTEAQYAAFNAAGEIHKAYMMMRWGRAV
jgi:uncharacterized damage-inducible protein DinB